MKINQLFAEQAQLDEGPIGQAIAKGVGGVAKGIGATVGGAAGAWDAAKQGYQAGKAAVSGQSTPAPTAKPPATPADSAQVAPATGGVAPTGNAIAPATEKPSATVKGTADFGTIQRSIKTLSPKQKTALSAQLSGKSATTPVASTPEVPTTAPAAPAGPQTGQEVSLASGEKYKFMGQQWVEIDPTTGAETGGVALPAGFQKSLTGIAAKQSAAPATTGAPDLKVVNGGKTAVGEGFYYRSKFLNTIL